MDKLEGTERSGNNKRNPDQAETSVEGCTPPLVRRFKSGQSGNRKGRPRGSRNRKTIIREIAQQSHTISEHGKECRRTVLEMMLLALRNLALEGNVRAMRAYEDHLNEFEPQDSSSKYGCMVAPAALSPGEWVAEQERLNAERKCPLMPTDDRESE